MDILHESEAGDLNNIPTRAMRIKILYTFDAESKTTCLARLPEARSIPTVAMDEQSHVGIIDLQTCIQAVVAASPEIISKMDDGDFAVYAYDYSEMDTPLLGQGRLSTLLANTSLPGVSSSKITGRVCQNLPLLFSNGVKETLEIKLRFTPVRRPTQMDVSRSGASPRSSSPATSTGFDPNVWETQMQQARMQQSMTDYFDFGAMTSGEASALEEIFGLTPEDGGDSAQLQPGQGEDSAETPSILTSGHNPAFPAQAHSAPGSRTGSPMMGLESGSRNDVLRHQSFSGQDSSEFVHHQRPGSRAGTRTERHRRQSSIQSQYDQSAQANVETFYDEDGRSYKRAKVVPADWRGKSHFGHRSADLRINAATASSMHMHRPIPRRAVAPGSNLEPPPRVPTPVPQRVGPPRGRLPANTSHRSMLREASTLDSDDFSDGDRLSEAIVSSPEGSSPGDSILGGITPMDIPSSPPVFIEPTQNEPSSPGLPTLPTSRFADSGYMSERGFDSSNAMMSTEDCEGASPEEGRMRQSRSLSQGRCQRRAPFIKREESFSESGVTFAREESTFHFEEPGDMGRLPNKMLLNLPPHRREENQSRKPRPAESTKSTATPASYADPTISRRSSIALPTLDTSQAQSAPRQSLHRSHTGYDSDVGSPAPSDTEGRPQGLARSGSAAPRRKIIEQRLQDSLARGEMPQYCDHCGAIETPTWRKLYVKEVVGKPGPLDSVEGEGETIAIEEIDRDLESGEVTKFRVRKSMKRMKDMQPGKGFKDIFVCNPCGLWFTKFKTMRPSDKWHRKPTTRRKKAKDDDFMSTDAIEPPSEAYIPDHTMHDNTSNESLQSYHNQNQHQETGNTSLAPSQRPRANSLEMQRTRRSSSETENTDARYDMRKTRSSPVRYQGSQHSPIELDTTPKPTRRLLFPSPRQKGEVKSLEDSPVVAVTSAMTAGSAVKVMSARIVTPPQASLAVLKAVTNGKENVIPLVDDTGDEFAGLFDGSPSAVFKTPLPRTPSKTPRTSRQMDHLLKTPTPNSGKRKALAETSNPPAEPNPAATPSSARYFLRSTPSRLERTPSSRGQRSISGSSPFTHHLTQMLNDGTAADPMPFTSPSQHFDFSDLPTFTTPGREVDWKGIDEMLSSEFANFDDVGQS